MPVIHTIDLHFLGESSAIAAYAVQGDDGYTLVECGPFVTHETLLKGLAEHGIQPHQIKAVLLTHIHFDHAGAAWWWAQQGAQVYVHPRGLRHMINPTRLYGSAARIYGGANMEKLWGRMESIDPERITALDDRAEISVDGHTWVAHHTPGHASHHIAWQLEDVVFTGDVGGVTIKGGPVVPPLPPPDVDVVAWRQSIARLRELKATTFYLTHFGGVPASDAFLDQLGDRLEGYVNFIREAVAAGKEQSDIVSAFTDFSEDDLRKAGVAEAIIPAYRAANPPFMSVTGILRWLGLGES